MLPSMRATAETILLDAVGGATPKPAPGERAPRRTLLGIALHVHRFRFAGEDPFGAHNLYRCRCGVVRPGL